MARLAPLACALLALLPAVVHCGLSPRHGLHPARTADGRIALLAVDSNRFVRRSDQVSPTDSRFSKWSDLGGIATSAPALGTMGDGREVVIVRGESNTVMAKWAMTGETDAGTATDVWSVWSPLGGSLEVSMEVTTLSRGPKSALEVYALGVDGHLYLSRELRGKARAKAEAKGRAPFSRWVLVTHQAFAGLPKFVRAPGDGVHMAFIRGADNFVYSARETKHPASTDASAGARVGWTRFRSDSGLRVLGDPQPAVNADGRVEVFVRGADNAVHHKWQRTVRGASQAPYSPWRSLRGLTTGNVAVVRSWDRRLQVFARGSDNAVWTKEFGWNDGWGHWSTLGGKFTGSPKAESYSDGRVILFGVARDATLWYREQGPIPKAAWMPWKKIGGDIFD